MDKQAEELKKKKQKLNINQNINKLNPNGVQIINEQIRVDQNQTALYG